MRRLFALCLLLVALAPALLASGCESGGDAPGAPAESGPTTTEEDKGDYGY
jgi:hypothetical protein